MIDKNMIEEVKKRLVYEISLKFIIATINNS